MLSRSRRLMSAYDGMADMIRLGAYRPGSDLVVDEAILKHEAFEDFLRQGVDERASSNYAQAACDQSANDGPSTDLTVHVSAYEFFFRHGRHSSS